MKSVVQITGLFLYPIKSCRAIALTEAEFDERGFQHDREFLVVDENDCFLTQRNAPELATVAVAIRDGSLCLTAATEGELNVSLGKIAHPKTRSVKIFNDRVLADDAGDAAANWFSAVLKRNSRLVRIGAAFSRVVPAKSIAQQHRGPEKTQVPFTDAFPILIVSEASLADLNTRLSRPLPMDRFRPNIVVNGCEAYAENEWNFVCAGDLVFRSVARCGRCVITTTDQTTGADDGPEPLRTLATYRRSRDGRNVIFGQYLIHVGRGTIRAGDRLETEG